MIRDLESLRHQAGELDARLAATRHMAQSPDGMVSVVVTGQGKVVDLRIVDEALHGPHSQVLGPKVLQTIDAARNLARGDSLPQLNALFGKTPQPFEDPLARAEPATYAEPGSHHPDFPGNSGMDNTSQWKLDPSAASA